MKDLQTLFSEALHLHQQGLLQEARLKYQRVLDALPENISVLGNMGIVCRDLGDLEAALSYCLRAAQAAPEDSNQHINLGAVYETLCKTDEARECYRKALSLVPAHPKALNNLGKLLHQQGDTEKGLELIRKSVTIEPCSPLALNNLGVILSERGDTLSAIDYIERSLQHDPNNTDTIYNLAGLHNCRGNADKAANLLERLLRIQPDHSPARHMLAALQGTATEIAPEQYVTETFDKYAGRFDRHIQDSLGYTVPSALAAMIRELEPETTFEECLDLGCGTGLSGEAFRDMTARLTGVDLSPKMLERASGKKIYDRLLRDEVITFLEKETSSYDLFVATDVLIYIGKIEPLLAAMAKLARPDAVFACSIERFEGPCPYTLRSSGRYAHTREYLVSAAKAVGFTALAHREHDIRKENNTWIPGDLYIFRKSR